MIKSPDLIDGAFPITETQAILKVAGKGEIPGIRVVPLQQSGDIFPVTRVNEENKKVIEFRRVPDGHRRLRILSDNPVALAKLTRGVEQVMKAAPGPQKSV